MTEILAYEESYKEKVKSLIREFRIETDCVAGVVASDLCKSAVFDKNLR
jgi:hypothetical protein